MRSWYMEMAAGHTADYEQRFIFLVNYVFGYIFIPLPKSICDS